MVPGDAAANSGASGHGAAGLPEELEGQLYAACFDAADPRAALAALLAAAPQHAATLRRLADALLGVQQELRVLDDAAERAVAAGQLGLAADGGVGAASGEPTIGPGSQLGTCVVDGEIGRGAFGVVYRARQLAPVQRPVAIKVLTWHRGAPEVLRRFAAERDLLARLDHPGVTRVYDAGVTADGQPFFVMELVAGAAVTDFADAERLSPVQRLRLFVQVCDVVQHAHQLGVVHRDLKPGNVLVRRRDQAFEVKVIDFGLAKLTANELSPSAVGTTELGRLMGTPEYMSPEQARGLPVDTRTDVHALGVMLFQLLTGALPFPSERLRSQGLASVVRVLEQDEAPLPSRAVTGAGAAACGLGEAALRAALRGDLDLVVRTCLQKERDRRYGSVAELAADVVRHLEHQPLSVRPPRLRYVLGKLLRRHRLAGAAALLATAALLIAAVVLAWSFVRVDAERAQAEANAYAATIAAARAALESERAAEARSLLADADPRLRGLEYDLLAAALDDAAVVVSTDVRFVGGLVAVADDAVLLDREQQALVVVSMAVAARSAPPAGERVPLLRATRALAVDPGGELLAIVQAGGRLQLRAAATRTLVRELQLPGEAGDVAAFSHDGSLLFLTAGAELWIVDVASGALRHRCRHRDNLWDIAVDPRRQRIAVSDHSGDVRVWDPLDGVELDVLSVPHVPQHLCFHARQDVLFVADDRCTIRRYDLRSRAATAAQFVVGAHTYDLACSADGETLLSCHGDGSVRAWATDSLLEQGVYRGHAGAVVRLLPRGDGGWWSAGVDRTVRSFAREVPQRSRLLPSLHGTPARPVLSADHSTLYVATLGGAVGAIDLTRGTLAWSIASGRPRCHGIALIDRLEGRRLWVSSGERLLLLAAADGSVLATAEPLPGRQLRDLRLRPGGARGQHPSRANERALPQELVVAVDDGSLLRCDVATGRVLASVPPPPRPAGDVYELVLHREEQLAVVCGPALGVACSDLAAGAWRWRRTEPCHALASDPHRGTLLLLLADGRLLEVEEQRGTTVRELWRGDGAGSGVALWGDGSRILVNDSRTHVLSAATGRDLLALPGGRFYPSTLCVEASGKLLLVGGGHFHEPSELRHWPLLR